MIWRSNPRDFPPAAETSLQLSGARLADARSKMYDLSDVARVRGREAARMADDYVRESPWISVGAAAGIGFLVGVLLARR